MFGIDFAASTTARASACARCCCPTASRARRCASRSSSPRARRSPGPGAKEPGESEHTKTTGGRRRVQAPGVPGPEWGRGERGGRGHARSVAVLAAFLVLPLLVGQAEHKVMAHMQGRLGPMYAGGFHGWAQLVADGVEVRAEGGHHADRRRPGRLPVRARRGARALPRRPRGHPADARCGRGGRAGERRVRPCRHGGGHPRHPHGRLGQRQQVPLLGAMRAAPSCCPTSWPLARSRRVGLPRRRLALPQRHRTGVAAVVAALAGAGAERWSSWSPRSPSLQRPPFDMPVADAEIVFGAYTEYTGLRFAFFLLAEYAGIVVMSCSSRSSTSAAGRDPSPTSSAGWTLLKGLVVAVLVIWLRVAWPRLREDQLQHLAWLVLVPVALAQLALTGVWVVVAAVAPIPRPRSGGALRAAQGPATTAKTLARPTHTAEYPDAPPHLPPRTRGVIALLERTAPPACCAPASARTGASTSTPTRRPIPRPRPAAASGSATSSTGSPSTSRSVHVLRDLHRGLPVRRAALEPRSSVLRTRHPRPAAREGPARPVDAHRAPPPALDPASAEPAEITAANKPARMPRAASAPRPPVPRVRPGSDGSSTGTAEEGDG